MSSFIITLDFLELGTDTSRSQFEGGIEASLSIQVTRTTLGSYDKTIYGMAAFEYMSSFAEQVFTRNTKLKLIVGLQVKEKY